MQMLPPGEAHKISQICSALYPDPVATASFLKLDANNTAICFASALENNEDRILRLISRETLANDAGCDIMNTPQRGRPCQERTTS